MVYCNREIPNIKIDVNPVTIRKIVKAKLKHGNYELLTWTFIAQQVGMEGWIVKRVLQNEEVKKMILQIWCEQAQKKAQKAVKRLLPQIEKMIDISREETGVVNMKIAKSVLGENM